MKSAQEKPVFPYDLIREEFPPDKRIAWEDLARHENAYTRMFALSHAAQVPIPILDKESARGLAERAIGRPPSEILLSRLYLLAGWQIMTGFRDILALDLRTQRAALKRLQQTAFDFWKAQNQLSGEMAAVLSSLHADDPDRLMHRSHKLDFSLLGCATYDLYSVCKRALDETSPRRTGRDSAWRRDTTVRLATELIEAETGTPLTTSRGNATNPAPHFTNGGGILLRDFFKLVDPRTDEASNSTASMPTLRSAEWQMRRV